jgi:hypothetical protein
MKFKTKISVLCLVVILAATMFGFAINVMAADEYLQSLTVKENGSVTKSHTVTISKEMTVDIGTDCNYLKLSAVCKDGYEAVVMNGQVEEKLSDYDFNTNNSVNELEIKVKNTESNEIAGTYNLTAYKINTAIKNINVTYNDKSYIPNKSGNDYSLSVTGDVKSVKLAVEAESDQAVVKYGEYISSDGTIEFGNSSSMKVSFFVYAYEGAESFTKYTLTINKSNVQVNDADLKSLGFSKGSISPSFSPSTTKYRVVVPYSSSTTTITATAKNPNAKVLIDKNSSATVSSFDSAKLETASLSTGTLSRGSTVKYYVHVLAADGTTIKTYSIDVYRSDSSVSDDARLSKLSAKYGSSTRDIMPSFSSDTKDYYLVLPKDEDSIKVYPTAKDSSATITVDGYSVDSGSYKTIDLSTGYNTIRIKVTSSDGSDTETYYLYVYCSTKSSGSDYEIDSLKVKAGSSSSSLSTVSLNKTFSGTTYSYNVNTDSKDKYFAVSWEPVQSSSVAYLIYGDVVKELSSGSYCSSIKISSSYDSFVVRAYSPDCEDYKDYKFTFGSSSSSSEAHLSGLVVRIDDSVATLSPYFSKNVMNYTVNAPKDAKYVTITPTAVDSDSKITVNGTVVKSGSKSANISLSNNSSVIPIVVTSPNGYETYRYYVTINKNINDYQTKIVMKANSTNYTVNGVSKTLLAAPYLDTENSRTLVPIRAIAEAMGATVDYNGTTKLITVKLGDKTLTMTLGKEIKVDNLNYGTPGLKNGTTFVPIRYVSEQLGAKVVWDNTTKTVTVTK